MNITKESFGQTQDGTPVDLYTLTNDRGLTVKITNYGGIIVSLRSPDRAGQLAQGTPRRDRRRRELRAQRQMS